MGNENLEKALIDAYRSMLVQRYQFDKLVTKYKLPAVVTPERVEEVRNYFLEYVYPDFETRQKLDNAFHSLDGHIKNPGYLLRLLLDTSGIMLRYGRHLPKIMRTGIKALQSFRKASGFEKMLYEEATERNMELPIYEKDLKVLIASLPQSKVNAFIEDNDDLFDALMDKNLMEKTSVIMKQLITLMNKKPKLYSTSDVEGIEIGLNILEGAVEVVKGISQYEGQEVLEFVKHVERDSMDNIFEAYHS